jgi:hypothetical protein
MKQLQHSLIFAFALSLCACGHAPKTTAPVPADSPSDSSSATLFVDANDLLDVLQGRWQSEQDAAYELDISGSQMRHFRDGKLSQTADIEVDASCRSAACATENATALSGWCFVEKGQHDAQCCLVTRCDSATLQYRAIGAAGGGLTFRRK